MLQLTIKQITFTFNNKQEIATFFHNNCSLLANDAEVDGNQVSFEELVDILESKGLGQGETMVCIDHPMQWSEGLPENQTHIPMTIHEIPNDSVTTTNEHLLAFIAMHSPKARQVECDSVYEVWEDGEVTLQKCGSLYGQRNLHSITLPFSKGNTNFSIPFDKFPKELQMSRNHACIAVNNDTEVKQARKLLWEAIKLNDNLGDINAPHVQRVRETNIQAHGRAFYSKMSTV